MAQDGKITNPLKAIRANCLECACDSAYEVRTCPIKTCPLHPFRFGKNPYRKKVFISEERKQQMLKNLEKARQAKGK